MAKKNNLKNIGNEYWRRHLTPEQYKIMREKGTEAPGSGKFNKHSEKGTYACAACGENLFSSDAKFDSGSGWPSFYEALDKNKVDLVEDNSLGTVRTEVVCKSCGSHLGHVFEDLPAQAGPDHKRYCINSVSLAFSLRK